MRKLSRARKPTRQPEARNEVLERLKEIAAAIGLDVREERLTREVGYSVRGGVCVLDGAEIVLLDKNVDPFQRIETLCGVLAERDLDTVYIEPELRRMIGGRALAREASPAS